jgi:hypothetical protein
MGNNNSAESKRVIIKENLARLKSICESISKIVGDTDSQGFEHVNYPSDVVTKYSKCLDRFTLNIDMKTMDEYNITHRDSLLKLCSPRVNLVIFKEIMVNNILDRNCDIIFAIESKFTEAVLCKIFIGGQFIHEFTLLPDNIEWILNGCPISLISLQYHEVKIELYNVITNDKINMDNNVYIYKMNLQTELRRDMAHKTSSCDISDKYIVRYASGMVDIDHTKKYKEYHHFNRRPPIDYIKRKTEEFMKIIKEELMGVTWEPSRVLNWCIDEDEKANIKATFKI